MTVDGDTSTSDTLMLFATARAGHAGDQPIPPTRASPASARRWTSLLIELAQLVAKDGEGARKFVTVRVTGAESDASAHRIAMSIANSPLVKTAVAGEDANWGRVVMAVGKAGEPADRDRLAIWFGDVRVAVQGARDPDYSEAAASAVMREAGDRDPGRSRAGRGLGARLDLRPDQGLHRDQRGLPLMRGGPVGRPPGDGAGGPGAGRRCGVQAAISASSDGPRRRGRRTSPR